MKRLLALIVIFFLSASPAFATFQYSRSITIDPTKVGGLVATPVNFPVLINGVYSYLANVANSGKVQSANFAYDVGYYTNSDCATGKMNWEQVLHATSTGTVEYYVKSATLSTTTNTVFYMCYGDSSISTDQSSATSVWDSSFKAVWHLPNGTTLTSLDSTSNANNSTAQSMTVTAGKIDGGAINSGAQSITFGSPASLMITNNITLSQLFKTTNANNALINNQFRLGTTKGIYIETSGGGVFSVLIGNGAASDTKSFTSLTYNDGLWHKFDITFASGVLTPTFDGVPVTPQTSATVTALGYGVETQYIGRNAAGSVFLTGSFDEGRISSVVRSPDWLKTEYNAMATSTFYTVGPETAVTSPISRFFLWAQMFLTGQIFIN